MFVNCLMSTSASGAGCREMADQAEAIYPRTRERVEATLRAVKERSPEARVLLVGYLRIVPEKGDCADLPVSEANRARAMTVEEELARLQKEAARALGVSFVDVRGSARGHDACAGDDAWVNGMRGGLGDGAVLHPNRAGMRAVADLVLEAVG